MTSLKSAHDLLGAEIKDLYSAEKQLTKAIPKLIAGANNADLKAALTAHLDETKQQVVRLETVAEILEIKPSGLPCKGMEGIIEEGAGVLSTEAPPAVCDLGIIATARRVEHYEMAGYMTALGLAESLHLTDVATLLREALFEEKGADESLEGQIAGLVAASMSGGEAAPRRPASARTHGGMAKSA